MKKILLAFVLFFAGTQVTFAQSDLHDLQEQMQRMQEQMSKMMQEFSQQFGNSFHFDTTIVRQFDMRDFNGEGFPMDTSWVQEFHWDNFGDSQMKIDTFFFKNFGEVKPGEMPEFFNGENFSQSLNNMLEELLKNMPQYGDSEYNFDSPEELLREYNEKQGKDQDGKPLEKEANPTSKKKKRKTTIL